MTQSNASPQEHNPKFALLITGTRYGTEWNFAHVIEKQLRKYLSERQGLFVLVHGDYKGVDKLAGDIGTRLGFLVIPMTAQWMKFGNSAGPRRNRDMLEVILRWQNCGYEIDVLGFHNNLKQRGGTKDMLEISRHAGIRSTAFNSRGEEIEIGGEQ